MKRSSITQYLLALSLFVSPLLASAQSGINKDAIASYSKDIITLINTVFVPLLFALAFLMFVYGAFKYFVYGGDNDAERATGRQYIIWSLIGFAVMVSVWGLVNIILVTFNITAGGSAPKYPIL